MARLPKNSKRDILLVFFGDGDTQQIFSDLHQAVSPAQPDSLTGCIRLSGIDSGFGRGQRCKDLLDFKFGMIQYSERVNLGLEQISQREGPWESQYGSGGVCPVLVVVKTPTQVWSHRRHSLKSSTISNPNQLFVPPWLDLGSEGAGASSLALPRPSTPVCA